MGIRVHTQFDVRGAVKNLNRRLKDAGKATPQALSEVGEMLVHNAEHFTPWKTGRLYRSIYYQLVTFFGRSWGLQFGANKPGLPRTEAAPYAAFVHEDFERTYKQHPGKDVGPQYLTRTLDASHEEAVDIIQKHLRRGLERG